ncbi:MAG: signal recognition particle receptor subunit beta, partial [Arenicella sp.]
TVSGLIEIWQTVKQRIGEVPVVVALNKADLKGWKIDSQSRVFFDQQGWDVFETSAKDGNNVDTVFKKLVEIINCDLRAIK